MKRITHYLTFSLLVSLSVFSSACFSPSESSTAPLSAVVTQKIVFTDLPSASGIEKVENRYYVIGDDSPYLFTLDEKFKIIDKTQLLESKELTGGRIPKPVKPDLEAITALNIEGEPFLLVLGSGATEFRNHGYLVHLSQGKPGKVRHIDLTPLYQTLRDNQRVTGSGALNIEGVAANEEFLYVLQRFNPGGENVLLLYAMEEMVPFLMGLSPAPAARQVQPWALPDLENIKTGFSGVMPYENGQLLFTASAEETPNAVLDGEVYGSLVGWMSPTFGTNNIQKPQQIAVVTEQDGTTYKGKLESISLVEPLAEGGYQAVAVADSDDGRSELVVLKLTF
ncbi:hypothetical protein GU926_09055 [Nibribacter ruber]|uniref:Uncharacterized protein n=1 Tax=Nibribacter ruber TaxID=2698458 RepID=A0A6P1NZZ3_9BACT|nr:hypothetical protein [Nibribacter ruber]QHL87578.1 hypothetical protein GU926_09055 [Nibribacter ruber]